jgi:IclR family pca regulon transcriptional regulator
MSTAKTDPEFVQSLERGLSVIRCFGSDHQNLTLSEVARIAGITRAAARRFLLTLQALGYVASDDGKHFHLSPQILNLGYAYLSSMPWWKVAQSQMETVTATISESCSASVLDGAEIVYVARVLSRQIMTVSIGIGTRLPAYATSMGRVLLAHLTNDQIEAYFATVKLEKLTERTVTAPSELKDIFVEVRERGYCVVDQELETGVRSVAVPIFDRNGVCLAAMNVGTHAARITKAQLKDEVLPVLKAASRNITSLLP